MTNNEAITKLTNIMHDDHYSWSPTVLAAFGMAVEALKGAVGDCISRQAAIVVFRCSGLDDDSKDTVVKVLEQLPSAQPTHDNTSNALKSLDCIDRQAAIDALCKAGCGSEYCGISCDDVKAIEDLPSAQLSFSQPHEKDAYYDGYDNGYNAGFEAGQRDVLMKDLPSAQPEQCKDAVSKAKVLETYADLYDVFDDNKEIQNELHKVFDRINNLPSAQQEPLIRCRECKHWNEYDGMCKILKEYIFNDDYYCWLAERKEGEADGRDS